MLDFEALEEKIEDKRIYEYLGVHKEEGESGEIYTFRAYNERAERAELTGDFNSWGSTPMKRTGEGIFEVSIESDASIEGTCYKYRFYTDDKCILTPDAYAVYSQWGKGDASIVYFGNYEWVDGEWLTARDSEKNKGSIPINIYELHLGSWRTREGRNYTDGDRYLNYRDIAAQLVGYVSDMGYTHVCLLPVAVEGSPFSPTSKHGRPDDLKFFVDTMHRAGISVILEWESEPDRELCEYWETEFHIDGFLVNCANKLILKDESFSIDTDWRDTVIDYAETDTKYKKYKYATLNRALTEGFERERVLSISHSDISEGKRSLFEKMQGDYEEKFARLRLFYSFMMLHPGKKLTFMGCEFGEKNEWNEKNALDWFLVECEANAGLKRYVRAINHLYLKTPAIWENDFSWRGFEWISPLMPERGVMSFARLDSNGEKAVAAFNFCEEDRELCFDESFETVLNSDREEFGGRGEGSFCNGVLRLPPLSAAILKKKTPFFEKTIDYSSGV